MADRKNRKSENKTPRAIKSPRQLIAVRRLTEIVRNSKKQKGITLGKILRGAGYSESFSEQPKRAIQAKSFQELLDQYLPDDLITETHQQILKASTMDHYVFPKTEDDEEIKQVVESVSGCKLIKIRQVGEWKRAYFWTPDNQSRVRAIAEAYKVKNTYPAEKHQVEGRIEKVEVVKYSESVKNKSKQNENNSKQDGNK